MATSNKDIPTTTSRLMHDYVQLKKEPLPYVLVEFDASNIYEWHFVVRGLENTLLMGGFFHGKLIFPHSYPFQPPQVEMLTPLGCFMKMGHPEDWTQQDHKCSFSPEEWSPAMNVRSVLTGVLWKMFSDKRLTKGTLCANSPLDLSKDHAKESNKTNLANSDFCKLFPQIVDEISHVTSNDDDCPSDLDDDDFYDDDVYDFKFLLR